MGRGRDEIGGRTGGARKAASPHASGARKQVQEAARRARTRAVEGGRPGARPGRQGPPRGGRRAELPDHGLRRPDGGADPGPARATSRPRELRKVRDYERRQREPQVGAQRDRVEARLGAAALGQQRREVERLAGQLAAAAGRRRRAARGARGRSSRLAGLAFLEPRGAEALLEPPAQVRLERPCPQVAGGVEERVDVAEPGLPATRPSQRRTAAARTARRASSRGASCSSSSYAELRAVAAQEDEAPRRGGAATTGAGSSTPIRRRSHSGAAVRCSKRNAKPSVTELSPS